MIVPESVILQSKCCEVHSKVSTRMVEESSRVDTSECMVCDEWCDNVYCEVLVFRPPLSVEDIGVDRQTHLSFSLSPDSTMSCYNNRAECCMCTTC